MTEQLSILIQATHEPTTAGPLESSRIRTFAHKCYGYILTPSQAHDIWRLVKGLPVTFEGFPNRTDMRRIASGWKQCRSRA